MTSRAPAASCTLTERKPAVGGPTAPKVAASDGSCVDPVVVFDGGREGDRVCNVPAKATVVDLHDAWAPILFGVQADGTAPEYRATYLAAALEQDVSGKKLIPQFGLAELY